MSPDDHAAAAGATSAAGAVAASTTIVRERAPALRPSIAVLLGSGWAPLAERVEEPVDIGYRELPAFPTLGIGGHAGVLRLGRLGGREVAVLAGRKHAYETGDADAMKGAIRTLAALGITTLVQTNAAGSLRADMPPGALMLISDHLNVVQRSPLFNEVGDRRFVDMSAAYDAAHRESARRSAERLGQPLHEGIFAWVMGPQFETPAEIRWLKTIGADAVGMSTVPETVLARHAGLRVLAMVTNMAAGLSTEQLSHAHTLATAQAAAERAVALLEAVVADLEA
jgi:purine-nucleoside phosphorylase